MKDAQKPDHIGLNNIPLSIKPLSWGKLHRFGLQRREGRQNGCVGQILWADCAKFLRMTQEFDRSFQRVNRFTPTLLEFSSVGNNCIRQSTRS